MKKILFILIMFCSINLFSQEMSISELEQIIKNAEAESNVYARSYIHQYWQLADLYLDKNDFKNAYRIIINGLALDSWNYKYQKTAAEIELMNGEYNKAYNRFNFITNNLRELSLIYNDSMNQRNRININDIHDIPVYLPNYYMYSNIS